jgi:two-component system nitrate/nitrite response regulator NarL
VSRLISLVLIDDSRLSCEGVVAQIGAQPGFRLLAASEDAGQALQRVREARPHVVLLNLRQKGDDSLTLAGALHGEAPASRVIVMGLEPRQPDLASFVRAGVAGFIMADASIDVVVDTIRSAARGIQVLPPELNRSLWGQLRRDGAWHRRPRALEVDQLTAPEREVAGLLVLGQSNKEIAARLQIALDLVKHRVHGVLSKLEVKRRLDVAAFSQRQSPIGAPALSTGAIPGWLSEPLSLIPLN